MIAFLFAGDGSPTRPAGLAHALSVADTARHMGITPALVAGHGAGELAAAVVAGALDADDALDLAQERRRLLAAARDEQRGARGFVLGVAPAEVERMCAQTRQRHGYVAVAHVDAEQRVLISGNASSVDEALALAGRLGARAVRAPGGALHCLLMARAQAQFARAARDVAWRDPRVPLVADGRVLTSGAEIRAALAAQLTRPVRWTRCVDALLDQGCRHFLELGSGQELTRLVRRRAGGVLAAAADGPAKIGAFRERLAAGAAPVYRLAS